MDNPGVQQVSEGSGEQGKMEKAGSEIICGAPMTLAVKELMMMITMMIMMKIKQQNPYTVEFAVTWLNICILVSIWKLLCEHPRKLKTNFMYTNVCSNVF